MLQRGYYLRSWAACCLGHTLGWAASRPLRRLAGDPIHRLASQIAERIRTVHRRVPIGSTHQLRLYK